MTSTTTTPKKLASPSAMKEPAHPSKVPEVKVSHIDPPSSSLRQHDRLSACHKKEPQLEDIIATAQINN